MKEQGVLVLQNLAKNNKDRLTELWRNETDQNKKQNLIDLLKNLGMLVHKKTIIPKTGLFDGADQIHDRGD